MLRDQITEHDFRFIVVVLENVFAILICFTFGGSYASPSGKVHPVPFEYRVIVVPPLLLILFILHTSNGENDRDLFVA